MFYGLKPRRYSYWSELNIYIDKKPNPQIKTTTVSLFSKA